MPVLLSPKETRPVPLSLRELRPVPLTLKGARLAPGELRQDGRNGLPGSRVHSEH